jgi:hypothetical protein
VDDRPPNRRPPRPAALEAPAQRASPAAEKTPSTPEPHAAIDLIGDAAPAASWGGRFMMMIVLLVLMFAGAVGAGGMFREPLTRAMTRWHIVR